MLGLFLGNTVLGMEPIEPPAPETAEPMRSFEVRRQKARELIQQRAAREMQDRRARMESRKRAGISLQRPRALRPGTDHVPYVERIDHGINLTAKSPLR